MSIKTVLVIILSALYLFSCNEEGNNEYLDQLRNEKREKTNPETNQKKSSKEEEINMEFDVYNSSNIEEKLKKYGEENPETEVEIKTSYGDIRIRLYKNTPLHRANFIRLAKMDFYDSTIFYRVDKDFMIQGGVKEADGEEDLETLKKKVEVGSYRVPEEILEENFHKTGALAMANKSSFEVDPEKKDFSSDPYNFYIVSGSTHSDYQLRKTEEEYGIQIPESHEKVYKTTGGTPHLDGSYTVFGEVISGLSVVKRINRVQVDEYEWPLEDVHIISVEVIK